MPRIQGKACTVGARCFFPNSVGFSDGARQRNLHRHLLKAWGKHCRREAGQTVPWKARRRAGGEAEGGGCRAQPFMQQQGVSTELCSPRPLWLSVMLLCSSRETLFIPVPPGIQLSGWREPQFSPFPHKVLSRNTQNKQDCS